jgi:hypothetical protein
VLLQEKKLKYFLKPMKKDPRPLDPATEFLTLEEVAARWRRRPTTVYRLLRYTFKIPTLRLTSKGHLYAMRDIKAIEENAKHNAPLAVRTSWRKQPLAPGRRTAAL